MANVEEMTLSRSSKQLVADLGVSRGHAHQMVHPSKSPPHVKAPWGSLSPIVSAIVFHSWLLGEVEG